MDVFTLLTLAVGLAMDATAVAAARGLAARQVTVPMALWVALWFGGAQGLMPLLGSVVGKSLGPHVAAYQHWLAAAVLAGIGLKMIWDAYGADEDEEQPVARDLFAARTMSLLAVATSIDAFAVGVTLPMMGAHALVAALVIGVVTALLSALGLFLGRRFGSALGRRLDVAGGVVLLLLALRVLVFG